MDKIIKTLIADRQESTKQMVLDFPVATDNKLRATMLSTIFTNYGKYLVDNKTSYMDARDHINSIMKEFKEKNPTFCTANYTNDVIKNIHSYYLTKKNLGNQIVHDFLMNSSSYLKDKIDDVYMADDLDKAEEHLDGVTPYTVGSTSLAGYYLDLCFTQLKNTVNLDTDFANLF